MFADQLTAIAESQVVRLAADLAAKVPKSDVLLVRKNNVVTAYPPSADTESARGTALRTAMAAAVSGDAILLGPTTFDIGGVNELVIKANVIVRGAGMERTEIISDASTLGGNECFICPSDGSVLQDLKIRFSGSGYNALPYGRQSSNGFVNAVLRNVWIVGDGDCIFVWNSGSFPCSLKAYNCRFDSHYDQVAVLGSNFDGHLLEFYNCQFTGSGQITYSGEHDKNAVNNRSGTVKLYNCTITETAASTPSDTRGIWNQSGSGSQVTEAHHCIFNVSSAFGGNVYDAARDTSQGTVRVVGGKGSSTSGAFLANGTITFDNAGLTGLPASAITTGQLAAARGGTGTDLSSTGGTGQLVKQTSSGGALSVAVLTTADINGGSNMTAGSVLFCGASGAFAQDNSNFFWDDSNNRLGIGTASPVFSLHVHNAGGNASYAHFTDQTSGATSGDGFTVGTNAGAAYLLNRENGPVYIGANGNIHVTVTATGNTQIGAGAVATNATNGFPYIPTCSGTPTGTPTSISGMVPMVYDITNHKLYIYDAGWKTNGTFT